MINVIREPDKYSFNGNPMLFVIESDSVDIVKVVRNFNNELLELSFVPYKQGDKYLLRIDMSGYLRFDNLYSISDPEALISEVSGFCLPYTIKIGDDYEFNGLIFQGGISNKAFARLLENDLDMFSYRLDSEYTNFLFTTRTNDQLINIRETELHSFIFIHPGLDIYVQSPSGNKITLPDYDKGKICSLNLNQIRTKFEQLYNEKPYLLKVFVYGELAFTLRIIKEEASENRYHIRFRNSLGAFEVIEVTGEAYHVPEFTDEDNEWQNLNSHGFFENQRDRSLYKEKIEVESGYRSRNEYAFIQDMIGSNETYLIWSDGSEDRCLVSVDNLKYAHRQIIPNSIALVLTMVTDEQFVTPHISPISIDNAGVEVWATPDKEIIETVDNNNSIKYLQ